MNNSLSPDMKKCLLILDQRQFGSHVGTYHYCKYLNTKYNITVICWDYSLPKQTASGFNVIYVQRKGNIIQRNLKYIYTTSHWLRNNPCDISFIKHFRGCSLIRLLHPNLICVFDIRTGSINKNLFSRFIYDSFMLIESLFFRHITIISTSLAKRLKLSNKAKILPLGSETISTIPKIFDTFNLLYVGTLSGRDIDKTLFGFSKFYNRYKHNFSISYTIIGDGAYGEIDHLNQLVAQLSLTNVVSIEGRVPFTQLKSYFDTHNIGVSFVPLTDYFDAQPVTKTFDYLLSGMPVIATCTSENKRIVNHSNGVLIEDSIEDFYRGLETIMNKKLNYNSNHISSSCSQHSWKNIVNNLGNYLETLSS